LRPEVKHGLIKCGGVALGQQGLGELSRRTQAKRLVGERSGQYSAHVGVKDRDALTEGEGGHGVRGVLAHPGQGAKLIDLARHVALELVTDLSSRVMQVLRAPGIAQSAPRHEDLSQ
jgi:hypothetical protein